MVAVNDSLVAIYPTLMTILLQNNYMFVPDTSGNPILVKLDEAPLSVQDLDALAGKVEDLKFTLFTRNNCPFGQILYLNDTSSIARSDWDARRPTVMVTHGWVTDGNNPGCTMIRDAFLKMEDCNVIVLDWGSVAKNRIYSTVAKSIPTVAKRVAEFVNFLRAKADLNTANLQMIGHSLGAHIIGLSARIVTESCEVAQVVALDPAKPMFQNKGPGQRVDRTDARNVQVIHTGSGLLGISIPIGTSDFIANGGKNQPGCDDILGGCDHGRSYEYYSESITNPRGFPSIPEKSGPTVYMGGAKIDPRAKGIYNFKTGSHPPYALGG